MDENTDKVLSAILDPREALPIEQRTRYLRQESLKAALDLIRGPLWQEIKTVLEARQPADPDPTDDPHIAAARSFQNQGWRKVIQEIERLPYDVPQPSAPLIPETLTDPRD